MNTDSLPNQSNILIQIAAISAMQLGMLQLGYMIWMMWDVVTGGFFSLFPQIMLSNNAFFLSGVLLFIGGGALLMELHWAWILAVGGIVFRLTMVFWNWVQAGRLDLLHIEAFIDVLYLFAIVASILGLVLLLRSDTRRYLRIRAKQVALAVALACLLIVDDIGAQFAVQFM